MNTDVIVVKLRKSLNGRTCDIKQCVRGLGLKRINDTRELPNIPAVRGMIKKVIHMLSVVERG